MPIIIDGKKYYRTHEAIQLAGISRATFFRWLKDGIIPDAAQKDRRGWRLFSDKDIDSIRNEAQRVTASAEQTTMNL